MAILIRRLGWTYLWLYLWSDHCPDCGKKLEGLAWLRHRAMEAAIDAQTAHYVDCRMRPYNRRQTHRWDNTPAQKR